MTADPRFDPAALGRLRAIGGQELVDEIVGLFGEVVRERLAAARAGLAAGDLKAVGEAFHSVISSAGNVGAVELESLAVRGEQLAGQGDSDSLGPLVDEAGVAMAWVVERLGEEGEGVKTIAVIEDNPDNRVLVRAILRREYRIVEYSGGADGLTGCRAERPDLLLLDISLPGMDGTEVLDVIRSEPALEGLPVIALTAHAMADARDTYLARGFDGYVAKPITDPAVLRNAVAELL